MLIWLNLFNNTWTSGSTLTPRWWCISWVLAYRSASSCWQLPIVRAGCCHYVSACLWVSNRSTNIKSPLKPSHMFVLNEEIPAGRAELTQRPHTNNPLQPEVSLSIKPWQICLPKQKTHPISPIRYCHGDGVWVWAGWMNRTGLLCFISLRRENVMFMWCCPVCPSAEGQWQLCLDRLIIQRCLWLKDDRRQWLNSIRRFQVHYVWWMLPGQTILLIKVAIEASFSHAPHSVHLLVI